jgi:hypothetical protein
MPSALQDLYTALIAARQDGVLTLAAGAAGAPAIDGFLATLPDQSLTLRQADVQLSDQQQPATLVASGAMEATWPLPGLADTSVLTQTATITYAQSGASAPVTGGLAVTATLTVGQHTVNLRGSLGADADLTFAWDTSQGGTLSLADAAGVATGGQAVALLPPDLPPFSSLILSSFTLSFGYLAGAATAMQFSLDAGPDAIWDIIPGQHVLKKIGVTLVVCYQPLADGFRDSFRGNVHATLDLGRDFEVTVGLTTDDVWEVDVVATGGLPVLETLAGLAGASDAVASGLRAIGLGDITLQSVSIGISRDDGSLAFISMKGSLSFAEKIIDVSVELPDFQFGGSLSPQTPIGLTALLEYMLGTTGGLPDIAITELTLAAAPSAGYYSVSVTVTDGQITAGKYGLREVNLQLDKSGDAVTGGLSGMISLGTAELMLTAQYLGAPAGWLFAGELTDLNIGQLLAELDSTYGISSIPAPIKTLELTKLDVSYQTGSGAFAFDLEAGFTVEATPVKVAVTITVLPTAQAPAADPPAADPHAADPHAADPHAADPHAAVAQGTKGYSATFTGQVTFAGQQFDIIFDADHTGTDVLVADFVRTGPAPVALQALVAGISAELAQAIPPGISIELEEVKFVFLKQTASQWAFGLRLGAAINLSELPIVGSRLPPDQTLAIENLQILYSSADLTAAQTAIINPLLPAGVAKLPGTVGEGIGFDADVKLGAQTKHLHAGVTPPAAAAPAPRAAILAAAEPAAAAVPASSTDPVKWLDVNKQFGVFSFERVGVGYQDNVLLFALDASVALGPIAFSMQALTVGSPLTKFEPEFSLKGLALTFDRPPIAIGGAFLKVHETVAGKDFDSYYGELIVQVATFSLKALGGWAPDADPASFFIYLSINVPLGGPPFLFVTGLAGGFGINSRLVLPTIDEVASYPLLPGIAPPEQATPAATINAVIPALQHTFVPQADEYWVAAGIAFTSFEMIEARAVISVAFGVDLQIGVVGTCAMTFPTGDPYPVAYVEIDVVASFTPSTGLLAVEGKLSPASYLFGGFVKLTGGFAFYAWFSGEHQGDFVVSLGGYHPAFSKPANYPAVPRLQLAFSLGPVKVIGQAYFALTPSMFMAGIRLSATFEAGPIKAWFGAGVDFLISWAPFHYQASAWVTIGCSVDLGLFTLSVQIGAELQIWGPAFGGEALVDLDVVSFTIGFGAPLAAPDPVGWNTFATNFLPPPETAAQPAAMVAHAVAAAAHAATRAAAPAAAQEDPPPNIIKAAVTAGQIPQTAPGFDWILDPDQFRILTQSTIPANHGRWSTSASGTAELPNVVADYQRAAARPELAAAAEPAPAQMLLQLDYGTVTCSDSQVWAPTLNIAPMNETDVASYQTIALRKRDESGALTDYVTGVTVAPQLGASNTALWGVKSPADGPNAQRLISATLTGFAISPVPRHPDQVSDVPLEALIFGEGNSTGFGYQTPAVDQQFAVTSTVSADGETFTIDVAGDHTAALVNHGYVLSALTDPWVTSQRTATLDELRQLGFTTTAGDAVHLDTMAETALTDWPSASRIGLETWA